MGNKADGKQHIVYFDILNILACICVIALHHNGIVHNYTDTANWREALAIEVLAYWAVPIFYMLTGATLMEYRKRYNTKSFLIKRVKRTFIPFIAWSFICLVLKVFIDGNALQDNSVTTWINAVLNYQGEGVYWFFPGYFAICLMLPFLSIIVTDTSKETKKYIGYFLIITFLFNSLLPPLAALVHINWNIRMPISIGIFYATLGYVLSTEQQSKHVVRIFYILAVFACVVRYLGIYFRSKQLGAKDELFFSYDYFTAVLLAVGVFLWAKNCNWEWIIKHPQIERIISYVSRCSLGVYLIHKIVMKYEMILYTVDTSSRLWRWGFVPITYVTSLCIVIAIKKTKIFAWLVP